MSDMAKIVAILGPPGAGKSTQAKALTATVRGAVLASIPLLRKRETPLVRELSSYQTARLEQLESETAFARRSGRLAPSIYDDVLFDLVSRSSEPLIVLDGCPRGPRQARWWLSDRSLVRRTVFVELTFLGELRRKSERRQRARAMQRGLKLDAALATRIEGKVRTYTEETAKAIELIRLSRPVVRIDAEEQVSTIHERVLFLLGDRCLSCGEG